MYNRFLPLGYLNKELYHALSQNDEPPTLYALMNSYVNFNKPDDEKVKIIDLPEAFKDYLFDFDYPLKSELKADFEINFLTHYMMRRIGYETYMSFKIHLKDKLNQIMGKYNLMLQEFDKLDFLGTAETHTRVNVNSSSSSSSGSSSSTSDNRYSDTPQNTLTDVQSGTYLTDYTYNTQWGQSQAQASGNSRNDEEITIHRGDSTDEFLKFQNEINHIYTSIYKECDSLFYGII